MYKKTFQYKGQMIKYYNKVCANANIKIAYCYYSVREGCYICEYAFNK